MTERETDARLESQFREFSESLPRQAGPDVEAALLSAFRARRRRRWIYVAELAALIAGAYGVYSGVLRRSPLPSGEQVITPRETSLPRGAFVALPYAASGVPLGDGIILRVKMPASQLSAMGIPLPQEEAGEQIRADLLIGQDGVPRAVRFVQ